MRAHIHKQIRRRQYPRQEIRGEGLVWNLFVPTTIVGRDDHTKVAALRLYGMLIQGRFHRL